MEFFLTLCVANALKLKKVAIVKDYLQAIVEHINLSDCKDLTQLKLLHKYVEINNKMLIQGSPKLKKFLESLERKIDTLSKEKDESFENPHLDELMVTSKPSFEEREQVLDSFIGKLQQFFDDEILG